MMVEIEVKSLREVRALNALLAALQSQYTKAVWSCCKVEWVQNVLA